MSRFLLLVLYLSMAFRQNVQRCYTSGYIQNLLIVVCEHSEPIENGSTMVHVPSRRVDIVLGNVA